jgi:CDP-diacylglycerol pyrophosphatase
VPAPVYSDILLDRVQHCIDTNKPGYCQQCQAPRASAACKTDNACKQTTEVWAETAEFVAIRDIKMCGCPSGFVHGLVLPRATVTGIEDDRRPDAIWPLAWQVALEHMNASEIALAVNSKSRRSQNQLHVHIVRLKPDAQAKLQAQTLRTTNDLNDVWRVAQQAAAERHLSEYGVLVSAAPSGADWVVVTQDSPEALFTQAVCRP